MEAEVCLQDTPVWKRTEEEQEFQAYNKRVLPGHLHATYRTLTNQNGGGVLQPDDFCTKTGLPVLEVLKSKDPKLRDPPPFSGTHR